jgi:hypothetical protein
MIVLSHRGYWLTAEEKNTPRAFARSFHLGFGTETDLRDSSGRLVISHDPPAADALPAEVFFDVHQGIEPGLPLALNVKADGLHRLVKQIVERYRLQSAFVFDMSIPDTRGYLAAGLPVFTRHSEYEPQPAFYDQATGVWMDGFESDWMSEADVARHLDAGKRVCLVSPELHGRDHRRLWERLASMRIVSYPGLMLCTDLPEDARSLFHA